MSEQDELNNIDEQNSIANKSYLKPPNKNIDKIKEKMLSETKNLYKKQRYGFFSILHSNYLADEFYSKEKDLKKLRDENGKVKTQPRGIYTKCSKKGKHIDSYFDSNFLKENNTLIKLREKLCNEDKENILERVKSLKNKTKSNYKPAFVAGGIKEYNDIFFPDKIKYNVPMWKEPARGQNIDFKNYKVITRPRGIWTQPSKKGEASLSGVLFSYEKISKEVQDRVSSELKKEMEDYILNKKNNRKNKNYVKPFIPNSVSKCDVFQNNKDIYSINSNDADRLSKDFNKRLKNINKYIVKVDHINSFKPSSNIKKVII